MMKKKTFFARQRERALAFARRLHSGPRARKAIAYMAQISWPVYIILFFCILGLGRNLRQLAVVHSFGQGGLAANILWAMIVVYIAQIALIFVRERKVWVISAIQAFFCFYVYEDFTFLPLAVVARNFISWISPDIGMGWMMFIVTTTASALLSLELLKTYVLYKLADGKE